MADIGHLKQDKDSFRGRLRTLTVKLSLELHPNAARRGEGSPDFIAYAVLDGELVPIGGAWKKTVDVPGPNRGNRFLSITVDDPSFPAALNCAAFPPDVEGANWSIVWTRPRQANREAA